MMFVTLARRFLRWAWEREHDDKMPNVVAGISLAIAVLATFAFVVSPLLLLVAVALITAAMLMCGGSPTSTASGAPGREPGAFSRGSGV